MKTEREKVTEKVIVDEFDTATERWTSLKELPPLELAPKTERAWYVNHNIDLCQKCGYVSYKADNKGECPNCGRNIERACPECEGTGKLRFTEGHGRGEHVFVSCPDCNGTGIKEREAGE